MRIIVELQLLKAEAETSDRAAFWRQYTAESLFPLPDSFGDGEKQITPDE